MVPLNKPEVLLTRRGQMTVADLQAAGNPRELQALARQWAEAVWLAYAPQHELARAWLRQATRQR